MTRSSVSIVLAALVCLFLVPPAMAHEDDRDLVNILEGLERGMVALDRLGRDEAQEMLQRIANEVRRVQALRRFIQKAARVAIGPQQRLDLGT